MKVNVWDLDGVKHSLADVAEIGFVNNETYGLPGVEATTGKLPDGRSVFINTSGVAFVVVDRD